MARRSRPRRGALRDRRRAPSARPGGGSTWRRHRVSPRPQRRPGACAATSGARRGAHPDAFRVSLGWGPVGWTVAVAGGDPPGPEVAGIVGAAGPFDDAPVAADVGPGSAMAIGGPGAVSVARAVIAQVVTWVGSRRSDGHRDRRRPGGVGLVPLAAARCRARRPGGRRRRRHRGDGGRDRRRGRCVRAPRARRHRSRRPVGSADRVAPALPRVAERPCRPCGRRPDRRRAGDVPQRARDRLDRDRPLVARRLLGRPPDRAPRRRRRGAGRRRRGPQPGRSQRPRGRRHRRGAGHRCRDRRAQRPPRHRSHRRRHRRRRRVALGRSRPVAGRDPRRRLPTAWSRSTSSATAHTH